MRSQITALEALQQLDIELRELEDDLERYPQEISRYKEETENTKQSLAKAKEELNQIRKRKMESESKLSGNKDKIKKAEVKLFEIKTYREYEALQKEIGDVKKANADLEEDILKEMETLEGLETEVKEKENTIIGKEKNELLTGCNMNTPPPRPVKIQSLRSTRQWRLCPTILSCEETTEGE